jgi:hypothetical protein
MANAAAKAAAVDVHTCTRVTGTLVVSTLAARFVGAYVWRVATSLCWFDLHHTWPNGQVWALITRPDRGRPARVWLVGSVAQCL